MTERAGAAISTLLLASEAVTALVGDKIFPVVADTDVPEPFIVYRRTGLIPSYQKDSRGKDSIFVDVLIVSESYSKTIQIYSAVINAVERKQGVIAGVSIDDIRLADSLEDADENYNIQQLTFEILINVLN